MHSHLRYVLLVLTSVVMVASGCSSRNVAKEQTPRPATSGKINPKDGAELVLVPAGKFIMGSDASDPASQPNQTPQHSVHLDSYYIYKHPVTVAQYRRFAEESGRKMPESPPWGWRDDHPMVMVVWEEAMAYAKWAGASLPTEAQWEKAARGTDARHYPWGNDWDNTKLQCSVEQWGDANATAPVGSHPAGASPYGAMDMAGNVTQWCLDNYSGNYYTLSPPKNPKGPSNSDRRSLRGGSWSATDNNSFRAARRTGSNPRIPYMATGFRCVIPAD